MLQHVKEEERRSKRNKEREKETKSIVSEKGKKEEVRTSEWFGFSHKRI